jgi:hypothetical protein
MIRETKGILSQNDIESLFLVLSRSVAQTLCFISIKPPETAPVPGSLPNIPTNSHVSPVFPPSRPFNLERCSSQYSSSNKRKLSRLALQSQAIEATVSFLSNPLLTTHSDLPSILFPTAWFLTLGNNHQLKVSTESVNVTAVGLSGGALIALIAIVSSCFVLHKRHNRSETEEQIDEFDLTVEHNEEEEFDDEDENVFDLEEDDRALSNSNSLSESDSENWVRGPVRRRDDLGMDFDAQESFAGLGL